MTREYFMVSSLDQAEQVSEVLHQQLHVTDHNFHVMSLDSAGLQQHHLHAANILQKSDLMRGAELGVLVGICVALLLFCFSAFGLAVMDVTMQVKQLVALAAISAPIICGAAIGAWIGLRHESYKTSRFQDELKAGHHLIIVDAKLAQMKQIKKLLAAYPIIDVGEDSSLVLPFDDTFKPATIQQHNA